MIKRIFEMKVFKSILFLELKVLLRSSIFKYAVVFFLIIGGYSIFVGKALINEQVATIENAKALNAEKFEKLKSTINQDTLPNVVGNRLSRLVYNKPTSLAALSIGQSDLLPFFIDLKYFALTRQILIAQPTNPEKLLVGNIDLSFVFIQLLPLFMIALGYNLLASEKETGTLSILLSFPITKMQLITYRVFFRILISVLLAFFLIASAAVIIKIPFNYSICNWTFFIFCYILFWGLVLFVANFLIESSSSVAITLLAVWLFLVVLVPTGVNIYISAKYPSTSKSDLTQAIRHEYEEIWQRYDDPQYRFQIAEQFGQKYPAYRSDTSYNWSDKYMLAQFDNYDQILDPYFVKYKSDISNRDRIVSSVSFLNPVMFVQNSLNKIAKTDIQSYLIYQEEIKSYHSELKKFFYLKVFSNQIFKRTDFDSIPVFVPSAY